MGRLLEKDGFVVAANEHILVIDDDRKLCGLIRSYLESVGYRVSLVYTGPEGLEHAATGDYHAVILDVMLPGMDGFEVLRNLRGRCDVPVLMLTSRGDETDRIVGLELGADDYLPKTFSTRELLARLRAVTRRARRVPPRESASRTIVVEDLVIDPDARLSTLAGTPLDLTPTEFDLLFSLASASGRVLSRERLIALLAGRYSDVFDRTVDVHVSSLRRKLGDNPQAPRFIRTVRTVGYQFLLKPTTGQ